MVSPEHNDAFVICALSGHYGKPHFVAGPDSRPHGC